ncbi:hypothetical protein Cme02nite_65000 [Catellatospora methionotrophica]|uniref:Histidine kinase/HSP90-like ATPase domain-containing protein n=1 Tax=Catellatospora methionotrophica TaxID=121620 RepID=A0A8J3PJ55_9ACTN|nr:hypothetical protein Cme02nite_65000 [Catellatospora methionotrophica]
MVSRPFDPPPAGVPVLVFDVAGDLSRVRTFASECAQSLGLCATRLPALGVAISEIATNVLRHTSQGGAVRVWSETGALISEVTDSGTFAPPGRSSASPGGWGLRIADEVCDRVDLYSRPGTNVWRLVMNLNGCASAVSA